MCLYCHIIDNLFGPDKTSCDNLFSKVVLINYFLKVANLGTINFMFQCKLQISVKLNYCSSPNSIFKRECEASVGSC